ncbi:alginate export family protein [Acidobacterium sp. S8]|uniref:alginate export family protein n=1 Tax=Acidobacterium sp. S8 TaxID=1641854 RepID=UPI0020B1308D|nr:alginate export family protein [Acidobacterium sp. S8]
MRSFVYILGLLSPIAIFAQTQQAVPTQHSVNAFVYERARGMGWQWYEAEPYRNTYPYGESLLRFGLSQATLHWDWRLEITQPTIVAAPNDAVSPVTAQGQLGFGGTYYASNGNNSYPAAAFLKQAFARYNFTGDDKNLRLGRFEFFEGLETKPKNSTLTWLQTNRVSQRLISNFGFTNAQRSFDGVDAHYGQGSWDITAMAARSDQGVFNMNGNPELNVDVQYLAYSKSDWKDHFIWRAFAIGYHDGRTGIAKTDNRPLPVRQADHENIRIGTYGADFLTTIPVHGGQFDFIGWGVLQNGKWGPQDHRAGAAMVEGGYQLLHTPSAPWVRGGWFRSSGDNNPSDNKHGTFFEILPTPRSFARFPIYNLMNLQDKFVQVIDRPRPSWELRSDLHWVSLTSNKDLWYQGGGAFDNKVFGYTGRPSNGASSLTSIADISSDWHATKNLDINSYYGYSWGKTVVGAIYPENRRAQLGYLELVYHWNTPLSSRH